MLDSKHQFEGQRVPREVLKIITAIHISTSVFPWLRYPIPSRVCDTWYFSSCATFKRYCHLYILTEGTSSCGTCTLHRHSNLRYLHNVKDTHARTHTGYSILRYVFTLMYSRVLLNMDTSVFICTGDIIYGCKVTLTTAQVAATLNLLC
jgi:hypothetical protein